MLGLLLLGAAFRSPAADGYLPGSLIVKLAPSSTVADLSAELQRAIPALQKSANPPASFERLFPAQAQRLGKQAQTNTTGYEPDRYLIVRFGSPTDADAAFTYLSSSSSVEFVQRNYLYRIDAVPNDSAASSQWNLQRIGVVQLWNEGFFSASRPVIKVGVVDTGIDYLHPDLAPAIGINEGETGTDAQGRDKKTNGVDDDGNGYVDDWHGYNFVESDIRSNDPDDNNGHGTSVAGIIGAVANNRIGVAGIAPCALMPLRAFNSGGEGSDADVAAAIVYAVDNGCSVINMSFGVTVLTPVMRDAVRYAVLNNVILIASSGNDGNEKPHYPSDLEGVIAVGSISQYDSRSYFSSYGPALALSAPGENIVTTTPGGGYTSTFSGTSAAAPNVTGVAALVKSVLASDPLANAVPFTNEEFRALLANSTDDIGRPGWETETGAGVVNAYKAVRSLTHNAVTIASPAVDAVLPGGAVPVMGTAVFSGLKTLGVYVGAGEKPDTWVQLAGFENRYFFADTIAVWNTDGYADGTYTLRLAAQSIAGSDVEQRVRVLLKRSTPVITSFIVDDSVVIADEFGAMVRLVADRPVYASLMFRPKGGSAPFIEKHSDGIQKHHYFLLTSKDATPGVPYEVYCSVTDNAGQRSFAPSQYQNAAALPSVTVAAERISTTGFNELPYTLPSGFLLNAVGTFTAKPTVIMNRYDESNNFGALLAYQFSNGAFAAADSLMRSWVPRDFADVNGDGVEASLVQDHGVTQIIATDPVSKKIFARPVFGDSSDVWGSQFYDIDKDGKLDLIARSSDEYLVYKNQGANKFAVAAHLADPTDPLPGEAKNQFGPPKSLVGNFTGLGKTEIVFADYDGDVMMYRQTGSDPFSFGLAWTDTSSLYETSEFIAVADLDGDGVSEIISAGHSNLDYNEDREYDAPFWTVRIFAHAGSSGTMAKVWEKKFIGVRSGFQNDNGVTTGNVMGGNDQLLLSLNPYFYIVRFDAASHSYAPVWIHNGETNAALVYDFNRNGTAEFGIHADFKVRFFEHQSADAAAQAPWGVTAEQRTEHGMRIVWNSPLPGAQHAVYRDTVPNPFTRKAVVAGTEWFDSTVTPGTTYYYTVAVLNPAEGTRSDAVQVKAEHTPRIVAVEPISPSQVRITFNAEVDRSRFTSAFAAADGAASAQSFVSASPMSVIATFIPALATGTHALRMGRFYTYSGLENDTTQRLEVSVTAAAVQKFDIAEAKMDGDKTIRLRFSAGIAPSTLRKENFTVRTSARVFEIADPVLDAADPTIVVITTAGGESLTSLGLRVEVAVSAHVTSEGGVPLYEGKGQTVSFGINALTLAHPVVFPNPLRYLVGSQDRVKFVNIPTRCKVSIYTSAGHKVREQETLSTPDGLAWDLRDEKGELAASGVYIYRLVHLDDNGSQLESTMGKFAIIR
jgi:subtilisin family serine protease